MKKAIVYINSVLFITSAMFFVVSLSNTTQEAEIVMLYSALVVTLSAVISLLVECHDYLIKGSV